MGKRGRKGTVISSPTDIRRSSYRKARGFRQCQPAQWSRSRAVELAHYLFVIWFSLCSDLFSPKKWNVSRAFLLCGDLLRNTGCAYIGVFTLLLFFKELCRTLRLPGSVVVKTSLTRDQVITKTEVYQDKDEKQTLRGQDQDQGRARPNQSAQRFLSCECLKVSQ